MGISNWALELILGIKADLVRFEHLFEGREDVSPEKQKILTDMSQLLDDLRNIYIRESTLPVIALAEIFGVSTKRIYQIRGKQKKAA
jgi:hypothetical protein